MHNFLETNYFGRLLSNQLESFMKIMRFSIVLANVAENSDGFARIFPLFQPYLRDGEHSIDMYRHLYKPCNEIVLSLLEQDLLTFSKELNLQVSRTRNNVRTWHWSSKFPVTDNTLTRIEYDTSRLEAILSCQHLQGSLLPEDCAAQFFHGLTNR